MRFINRQQELLRLNHLVRQAKAGVAVVWGRRRVGKTRLLLEWVDKHRGVYYTADESAASIQRRCFATALERALPGFSNVEYPDWATLLARLAKEATRQIESDNSECPSYCLTVPYRPLHEAYPLSMQ